MFVKVSAAMKYIILSYLVSFGFVIAATSQRKEIFVGEIHGETLDSFKMVEIIAHKEFKFPNISVSKHRIEIRLYETGSTMPNIICTILTYDTGFMRIAYRVPLYADSAEKAIKIAVPQNNLDSIFDEIVKSGIFSVESINEDAIKKNYRPMSLESSGLDTISGFSVSDGVHYFLEYKVDKYYDQEFFDNPEAYSRRYRDNQTLRRQNEIVAAINAGITNY